jgi:hypothetical protein
MDVIDLNRFESIFCDFPPKITSDTRKTGEDQGVSKVTSLPRGGGV